MHEVCTIYLPIHVCEDYTLWPTHLDSLSVSVERSLETDRVWLLHSGDGVGLLGEGEKLLNLPNTVRLGSIQLGLEFLDTGDVCFLSFFPGSGETVVELEG